MGAGWSFDRLRIAEERLLQVSGGAKAAGAKTPAPAAVAAPAAQPLAPDQEAATRDAAAPAHETRQRRHCPRRRRRTQHPTRNPRNQPRLRRQQRQRLAVDFGGPQVADEVVLGHLAPHFDGVLMIIRAQFTSAKLTLNQILFDGFFTSSEVHRLSAAKRTRYYELLEAAETTSLDAVKAYTDVVRFRELVDMATQNYVEHKQAAMLVEERVNGGVGRRADLEQANGRLALAESNLLTELTNLHDASARYLRVIGEVPAQSLPMLPEPLASSTRTKPAGSPFGDTSRRPSRFSCDRAITGMFSSLAMAFSPWVISDTSCTRFCSLPREDPFSSCK